MHISAKTEYACVAILELASRFSDNAPVRIKDIAERHGIPNRFLVQILLEYISMGLEHGHVHLDGHCKDHDHGKVLPWA